MAHPAELTAPERAYQDIKAKLGSGALRFRQRLDVNTLARELGLSVTPVREALIRLRVERLVAVRPAHGFFVQLWSEEALRQLYRWRGELALLSLADALGSPAPASAGSYGVRAAAILNTFAAAANPELIAAAQNADDRLARARAAETALWANADAELDELAVLVAAAERTKIARGFRRYHERRVTAARLIRDRVVLMDLPGNGG